MGKAKANTRAFVLSFLTVLLGSGLLASVSTWGLPTAVSTFYSVPNFGIIVPPDLSSVSVSNTGHGTAHNVMITILAHGNQTASALLFSSENATSETSYRKQANVTLFIFQLKRMARQASVSLELGSYSGKTLEVWAQSDETGDYALARIGFGFGQPDPVGYLSANGVAIGIWFALSSTTLIVVFLFTRREFRGSAEELLGQIYGWMKNRRKVQ